jgi:hypothetical protein
MLTQVSNQKECSRNYIVVVRVKCGHNIVGVSPMRDLFSSNDFGGVNGYDVMTL